MSRVYFSAARLGFFLEDLKEIYVKNGSWPVDVVEVSTEVWGIFSGGLPRGMTVGADSNGHPVLVDVPPEDEDKVNQERAWRDGELNRADVELYKVQDSDPKAVGTVGMWREYRRELRIWPEHTNFTIKESRPVAPDA